MHNNLQEEFAMSLHLVGQFYFVSTHNRLLQAYTDGEMHASQDVGNVGLEERWNVYGWSEGGGKISLQNYRSNRWLCAEPNGKAVCNREAPRQWEQWTLHAVGDGIHVAFLSTHNRWLCAQPPGQDTEFGGEVIANREQLREWERFSMIPSPGVPVRNQSWWNDVGTVINVAKEIIPIVVAVAGA
jgi:hypothetical protein